MYDKDDERYDEVDYYDYELNRKVPLIMWTTDSKLKDKFKGEITKVMGMYENKEKIMLVCVARKREIHKIVEIVEEADKQAFMWIGDAREVMGEGFVNIA